MRILAICFIVFGQLALPAVGQQASSSGQAAEVVCAFDDGQQLKVEYNSLAANRREDFHEGKIWEPGGSPMILFTQTPLVTGKSVIPAGAFSLYILPEKQNWTLIVSKNISAGAKYDEKQDLVRTPMQIGQVDTPIKPAQIAIAHVAPKQCNLRVYYDKSGAWAEFSER